jgi:hypothetical protein
MSLSSIFFSISVIELGFLSSLPNIISLGVQTVDSVLTLLLFGNSSSRSVMTCDIFGIGRVRCFSLIFIGSFMSLVKFFCFVVGGLSRRNIFLKLVKLLFVLFFLLMKFLCGFLHFI